MIRKTTFFEGWSRFKFNNLGLALGLNLKFYTSVAKGLKLKVRKFLGLIPTFVEVTGEKLVGWEFLPSILTRINNFAYGIVLTTFIVYLQWRSRVFLGRPVTSWSSPSSFLPPWLAEIFKPFASRCSKMHSLAVPVLRFLCKTFSKLHKLNNETLFSVDV